jgi:hypothetical protein
MCNLAVLFRCTSRCSMDEEHLMGMSLSVSVMDFFATVGLKVPLFEPVVQQWDPGVLLLCNNDLGSH